ncbi:TPA_asm: hypothetical protein GY030_13340 [Listeria monocytogenes]|nr:hypothetical protein [Listeria monocytogenes]
MITKINHILSLRSTSHILSALDVKHACGADWCVNQFFKYIAYLIAALKFDFTGYKIDPMDIVRVRITDYKENETQFKENQQKIETEIQKCGYEL